MRHFLGKENVGRTSENAPCQRNRKPAVTCSQGIAFERVLVNEAMDVERSREALKDKSFLVWTFRRSPEALKFAILPARGGQ